MIKHIPSFPCSAWECICKHLHAEHGSESQQRLEILNQVIWDSLGFTLKYLIGMSKELLRQKLNELYDLKEDEIGISSKK